MATLTKTKTPGIFRRHVKGCDGQGRCECSYVVVWRHRGKQHKETFRTYAEASEAQGDRKAGDRRPTSKISFEDYFAEWIDSYAGRTARGFSETTRPEYRRPIEAHAIPKWGTWRLAEVEPADVRELFGKMRQDGKSTSAIRKLRAALSAMFATAVEDGMLRSNPCQGVRIPAGRAEEPGEDRAKALTREELRLLLAALARGLAAVLRVPGRHRPADRRGGRVDVGARRAGRSSARPGSRAGLPGRAARAEVAGRPPGRAAGRGYGREAARPPPRLLQGRSDARVRRRGPGRR